MKKKKLKKKIKRLEKRNEELCCDLYVYFRRDATILQRHSIEAKYRFLNDVEDLLFKGDETDKDI